MTICISADDLATIIGCEHENAIPVASEPFVVLALPALEAIKAGDDIVLDMPTGKWRRRQMWEARWAVAFRDVVEGEVLSVPSRYTPPTFNPAFEVKHP